MNAISLSSAVSISISDDGKNPTVKCLSISLVIRAVSGLASGIQVECSLWTQAGLGSTKDRTINYFS